MATEIVVTAYRPKPGRSGDLRSLIERHVPLLRAEGFATGREPYVFVAGDGTFVEVFEWDPTTRDVPPHQVPAIKEIWDQMAEAGDFVTLGDLPEARATHASFGPLG